MSLKSSNKWFRRLSLAAVAACTLGAATIATPPANAAVGVWEGPYGGLHIGIVQHPHHDWWRQPGGWYYNPDSPRNWAYTHGYGYW